MNYFKAQNNWAYFVDKYVNNVNNVRYFVHIYGQILEICG